MATYSSPWGEDHQFTGTEALDSDGPYRGVIVAADREPGSTRWLTGRCCEKEHAEWWAALRCAQRSLTAVSTVDLAAHPKRRAWRYWCTALPDSELPPP